MATTPPETLRDALLRAVGALRVKTAGKLEVANHLSGRLYATPAGWVMLSVPNALMRGLFDALDQPGAELPPGHGDAARPTAHISVMRPEEVARIGGADKVTERGHQFRYGLGRVMTVAPAGWPEMQTVWFARVVSPELKKLRVSYGLSPEPDNGQKPFHLTFAVKRRGVLHQDGPAKGGRPGGKGRK